jgi:quercetin dioxygenase-like cupin family protein
VVYYTSADWQEVEAVPGVHRRVLSCGDQVMVVQFRIAEGADVPVHTHPHEQIGYLASGRARFKIGDEERIVEALDGYSIPGGVPHGVEALEDSVFVDVFSPPREEYRQ